MAWCEDYVLAGVAVFMVACVPADEIQDQTRGTGAASTQTIAGMSALARTGRKAYFDLYLGIVVQAHDAVAPIAIADDGPAGDEGPGRVPPGRRSGSLADQRPRARWRASSRAKGS